MIVYVESNFFLEVALEQEQTSPAEAILTLAESRKIELAFPGFALSEPFATIAHRGRDRRRLRSSFTEMLQQLQRSKPHKQVVSDLQHVPILLAEIVEKERDLLQPTVSRLLNVGRSIETNAFGFRQALVYQKQFALSPQDSIIYAAVVTDVQQKPLEETKCFLSRDRDAFGDDPGIRAELAVYNCRYISSFTQGLSFIQHTLEQTG